MCQVNVVVFQREREGGREKERERGRKGERERGGGGREREEK